MVNHRALRQLDPTVDAALLLRRMGFVTLGLALPVAAMASRRAAVVLVPIGVVLLVIAALILEPEPLRRALWRGARMAITLALVVLAGWIALSLIWGVRAASAPDRALNVGLALVLGWVGVAALPERGRAADLNMTAVGIGTAALLAATSTLTGIGLSQDVDGVTALMRGLSFVVVLAGPAVAWLLSRGRTKAALLLGTVILLAILSMADGGMLLSGLTALLAFCLVLWRGATATRGLAWVLAALVVLAPLLPFILMPPMRAALGEGHELVTMLHVWGATVLSEPIRLLTGHGLGTILRDQAAGRLPAQVPVTVLFQLWRELGMVAALALAIAILLGVRAMARLPVLMQAGGVSAYVTACGLGLMGVASFRPWWLMTLVAAIILTTLMARAQPRHDRPLARFVESARLRAAATERPVIPMRPNAARADDAPRNAEALRDDDEIRQISNRDLAVDVSAAPASGADQTAVADSEAARSDAARSDMDRPSSTP